jgi:hypothetical protein
MFMTVNFELWIIWSIILEGIHDNMVLRLHEVKNSSDEIDLGCDFCSINPISNFNLWSFV